MRKYQINTLGKSAIIDRELNSAYDVVEYVADNLPLLMNLVNSKEMLEAISNVSYLQAHMDNTEIHLSEEDRKNIASIASIITKVSNLSSSLLTTLSNVENLSKELLEHSNDTSIHVSQEEKNKWNNLSNLDLNNLADVSYSGSYKDLIDVPIVDSVLDKDSTNALENRIIYEHLLERPTKVGLSKVAFSGEYKDIKNTPEIDTVATKDSKALITSGAMYDLSTTLIDMADSRPITKEEIDEVLNGK